MAIFSKQLFFSISTIFDQLWSFLTVVLIFDHYWPFWPFWSFLTSVGHFWRIWSLIYIVGHFWPSCDRWWFSNSVRYFYRFGQFPILLAIFDHSDHFRPKNYHSVKNGHNFHFVKWDASYRWSSYPYCPKRYSGQMTIGKIVPHFTVSIKRPNNSDKKI